MPAHGYSRGTGEEALVGVWHPCPSGYQCLTLALACTLARNSILGVVSQVGVLNTNKVAFVLVMSFRNLDLQYVINLMLFSIHYNFMIWALGINDALPDIVMKLYLYTQFHSYPSVADVLVIMALQCVMYLMLDG